MLTGRRIPAPTARHYAPGLSEAAPGTGRGLLLCSPNPGTRGRAHNGRAPDRSGNPDARARADRPNRRAHAVAVRLPQLASAPAEWIARPRVFPTSRVQEPGNRCWRDWRVFPEVCRAT